MIEPIANKKNISLHHDIPEDIVLELDHNMMRSVFQNLISNAIKFTREGGEIRVSARRDGNKVIAKVQDSGIGISDENLKKLFVDEGQLTTRGTNDEKGSGLGLLLVKDFIQRNKGSISAESKVGQGTTFILSFPA